MTNMTCTICEGSGVLNLYGPAGQKAEACKRCVNGAMWERLFARVEVMRWGKTL